MGANPVIVATFALAYRTLIILMASNSAMSVDDDPGTLTFVDVVLTYTIGTIPDAPALVNVPFGILGFFVDAWLVWCIIELFGGIFS